MRKLQWYTKILNSIKGRLLILYFFLFALNFFTHLVFSGCVEKFQKNPESQNQIVSDKPQKSLVRFVPFIPQDKGINTITNKNEILSLGLIKPFHCTLKDGRFSPDQKISYETSIHSEFIHEKLLISTQDPSDGSSLSYTFGNSSFVIQDAKLHDLFTELMCSLQDSKVKEPTLNSSDLKKLTSVITAGTTGCQDLNAASQGWMCTLDSRKAPQYIEADLINMQSSLLNKYKRLPYTFARKVAISLLLARLEFNYEAGEHQAFCNLISGGGSVLPIAVASQNFQNFFCTDTKAKTHGGNIILNMAMEEINLINLLMQKNTKMGFLNIKVSGTSSADTAKEFLVQVSPTPDVESALKTELKSIALEQAEKKGILASSPGCWHPLYGYGSEDSRLAYTLSLIQVDNHTCPLTTEAKINDKLLLTSITASELEYRIASGRAKIIRLPFGEYTYKVFNDPSFENTAVLPKPIIEGRFTWDNSKNKHTLSQNIVN